MKPAEIDAVAFFEKPFIKFERLLETYTAFAPRGFTSFTKAAPIWVKEKLFQKSLITKHLKKLDANVDWTAKLLFAEHHQSHAASAFYPSPFDEALILTADGVGEWATASVSIGRGDTLETVREIHFPHSLGLLYSAFTYYLGFRVNSGEYKVMGLAPYGEPRFTDDIYEHLIDVREDGTFWLDMRFFDYATGLTMTNRRFDDLFGGPPRQPDDRLDQRHMDLAASIQVVTEDVMRRLASSLRTEFGIPNLCLAGGVALNCVANGHIHRDGHYDGIWVQPAAGDAGGAVGAALAAYHMHFGKPRSKPTSGDSMRGAYLGTQYEPAEIEQRLTSAGAVFDVVDDDELISRTVDALDNGKAVGWHQGAMEFGPRALGNRSIIADPRDTEMQRTLNLRVKYRESFRPFAPAVRREDLGDWFAFDDDSPYMLMVAQVAEAKRRLMTDEEAALFGIEKLNVQRSDIPAVTHVDYSARLQTVHASTNPRFHALLSAFKERTGCPVLVNTSFNVRGEPIVESPEDAFRCFMGTEIEYLAVGNAVLDKSRQNPDLVEDYKSRFVLD